MEPRRRFLSPPPRQARGPLGTWSSAQERGGGPSRPRNGAGDSTGGDTVAERLVRSLSPDTKVVVFGGLGQGDQRLLHG
jgi:hypothetical protein